jgi:hypothetical protein
MNSSTRLRYLLSFALVLLIVCLVTNWAPIMEAIFHEEAKAAASRRDEALQVLLGQFDTSSLTVPKDDILRGGPGKDDIPALTNPNVENADKVEFLSPEDRLVGITVNGESRAYPIRLLTWHEIVNDNLGSIPVAVIYCPLCDSVSVVDRRMNGETLDFGVSGLLYNSNVLLYDRTHHALWSQVGFEAVSGPHAGNSLRHLLFEVMAFEQWIAKYPASTVATFETNHRRDYERNPYEEYLAGDVLKFPAKGADDRRLRQKEPVVGVQIGNVERAYPLSRIAEMPNGQVEEDWGEGRVVIEALDGGRRLRIVEVPENALVVQTFWFAWNAFHPETTIFEPAGR